MSWEYDNYLFEHIENVKKGFRWMRDNLPDIIIDESEFSNIDYHDKSKRNPKEYNAYDAYFYGRNKSFQVVQNFNYAWLHHIHHNPHHWQYWVLINDDPEEGTVALEMPYEYIVEMICDWWSFSWKTGNLYGIFDWYEQHKERMILADGTKKLVERFLEEMRKELDKDENGENKPM